MKRFALAAALVLTTALVPASYAAPNTMWDLTDLYKSADAWTAAKDKADAQGGRQTHVDQR